MQASLWSNIIRFVFLVLLQGLVLEHVDFPGSLHWMVYPLFIILLPFQLPAPALLLCAFLAGLSVDFLCDVPGLNAASATLAAFVRILYFKWRPATDVLHDSDPVGTPSPGKMGWGGFLYYSCWVILFFHLGYFFLDAFSFQHFFYTLYLTVGSSFLCLVSLVLAVTLFKSKGDMR